MAPDEALQKSELDDKNTLSENLIPDAVSRNRCIFRGNYSYVLCTREFPYWITHESNVPAREISKRDRPFSVRKKFEPINDIYRKFD